MHTDAFPAKFGVHGKHGDVSSPEHFLVHVQLTHNGTDTVFLHHGLRRNGALQKSQKQISVQMTF